MTALRKGDRVRVSCEGTVTHVHPNGDVTYIDDEGHGWRADTCGTVELVLRPYPDGMVLLHAQPKTTRHRLGGQWLFANGEESALTDTLVRNHLKGAAFAVVHDPEGLL